MKNGREEYVHRRWARGSYGRISYGGDALGVNNSYYSIIPLYRCVRPRGHPHPSRIVTRLFICVSVFHPFRTYARIFHRSVQSPACRVCRFCRTFHSLQKFPTSPKLFRLWLHDSITRHLALFRHLRK